MEIRKIVFLSVFLLSFVSCGWKATEQDIKTMEDTRNAALKAKSTVKKKNDELRKIKQEVSAAKARKEAAEKELNKVKAELAKRAKK